jgi:hypothetical protein
LIYHVKGRTLIGVFENRVLRRIFEPERDEVTRGWRKLVKRSFIICTLYHTLLR